MESLLASVQLSTERSHDELPVQPDLRKDFNRILDRTLGDDRLSPVNQHLVWHDVFRFCEGGGREVKAAVLRFLRERFPHLAPNRTAIRWTFNNKLRRWTEGGKTPESLKDGRANSGREAAELCGACLKKVMDLAVLLDGNETQAHRRLQEESKLCGECAKLPLTKTIRRTLGPLVDSQLDLRRGERFSLLAGPYITRDWSQAAPGDWFVFDDTTLNHPFCFQNEQGEWEVARGEFLLGTDAKSDYPLISMLINGHYNSGHTRSLVTRAILKHGLPRVGVNLERGVWDSVLMRGKRRPSWHTIDRSRETENGLLDPRLQLRLVQSRVPRAKTIESAIGRLQERMRCEKGFVGFNERTDRRELVQDFIARVRAGKEDPRNQLWTQEEWNQRLSEILLEFAHDEQNGARIPGLSPAEAWSTSINSRPLRALTAAEHHILATHQRRCRVTSQGVKVTIPGRGEVCFANGALAPYRDKEVIAYINWEDPEMIVCSDLEGREFFTVKSHILPAYSATAEQFREARQDFADFKRPAKVLFDNIQHPLISNMARDRDVTSETRREAAAIQQATEQHKADKGRRQAKLTARQRAGADLEAEGLAELEGGAL
ncbi:MAG: hypothetical protein U1G07_12405 [Verrucomicrobiota bacterium]